MNKLILVETLFLSVLIAASLVGAISLTRTGQVLIAIAAYNLVLSLLAYFSWPVLRGNVSDFSPMSRQDALEIGREGNSSKSSRPSRSFVIGLLAIGVIALATGIGLILLQP